MSRIIANNIRHNDATVDSITLDSAGNVSVPNDLVVDTDTLFVDVSADRVGINTSSPQADLHIGDGTGNGVEINNTGTLQVIDRGNSRIEPLTVVAEHVAFSIARNTSTTLHDEKARITYDGLTFNGDTAAANALDDYEEGTWTPTWGGTSTYATQTGRYTKVGNKVTIWFAVRCTSIGTGGSVTLAGLPFGTASALDSAIPLVYWQNINSSAYWLTAYAPGGGYTSLYFMGQQGLDATQEVNLSVGKSSALITGSGTYLVP